MNYKKKAEAQAKKSTEPNSAPKRGRPQGSKNKKKMKTLNKENTDQNIPRTSTPNQISVKSQVSVINDKEINIHAQEDFISRPAFDKPLEVTPEVTDDIVEDVPIQDFFVLDGDLQSRIENEEIAENTESPTTSSFSEILPGTQVIFKDEGSLFTGKFFSMAYPFYVISCMCKVTDGGWKWSEKRDVVKIRYNINSGYEHNTN